MFTTRRHFSKLTLNKGLFYAFALLFFISASIIAIVEPLLVLPCKGIISTVKHKNPDYVLSSCLHTRFTKLLFMTPWECDLGRRLLAALVLGAIIGFERRQADRPAGVRTMSLVALGSALFTISSSYAFISGPMAWDAARVSAAIPSGVGFLGAGAIYQIQNLTDRKENVVVGITTATSVWLSAAVGVACGGKLYFVASFTSFLVTLLLRFGPRHIESEDVEIVSSLTASTRRRPPPSLSVAV
mmetsp:Transcript_19599/g.27979  ORF Transcript_19599/g.27979 Transcript_19599/m.27979 type:complete len:243 (+) Transcript_19599:65-793(+)